MATTEAVKERPILFSAPMVRALLKNLKTQTRRIVKHQPPALCRYEINGARTAACCLFDAPHLPGGIGFCPPTPTSKDHLLPCPYGRPADESCVGGLPGRWGADRLWVRETWSPDHKPFYPHWPIVYRADGFPSDWEIENGQVFSPEQDASFPFRWRPSIHMPRRASRITLEIVDIRVERLNDISEADVMAEGVGIFGGPGPLAALAGIFGLNPNLKIIESLIAADLMGLDANGKVEWATYRAAFAHLWESINGSGSWDRNDWVWPITFRKMVTQ